MVIEKNTYNAFHGKGLLSGLLELGVETIIVTGVITYLYREMTAREAFAKGFEFRAS